MANGFEFELSSGAVIQVVPKDGQSTCAISHGDTKIEIDVPTGSFKVLAPTGKAVSTVANVARFEPKNLTVSGSSGATSGVSGPHIMTSCMICNGQTCCVTNGCADFGCGWICG